MLDSYVAPSSCAINTPHEDTACYASAAQRGLPAPTCEEVAAHPSPTHLEFQNCHLLPL